jgi:hypothetical protein
MGAFIIGCLSTYLERFVGSLRLLGQRARRLGSLEAGKLGR